MKNLNYGFGSISVTASVLQLPQRFFKETNMDRWVKKIKLLKSMISQEIQLFLNQPKNYIYLAFLSNKEKVHFLPYDGSWRLIADEVIEKIHRAAPELEVFFIGSAKLGVLGEKDIDLFIEMPREKFARYAGVLTYLFDQPKKERRLFIEWNFMIDDCNIEVSLVDPSDSNFQRSMTVFRALKKNQKLLKKYAELKQELDNTSVRNYIHKRMRFFHQILKGAI